MKYVARGSEGFKKVICSPLKDANGKRKEMSNKDGFVSITELPDKLKEGHRKGLYPKYENK